LNFKFNKYIPGALIGFLTLLLATVLLGILTAVRVLLITVFLLIVAVAFFSAKLDETTAGFDSLTILVGFAVITAFSDASFI